MECALEGYQIALIEMDQMLLRIKEVEMECDEIDAIINTCKEEIDDLWKAIQHMQSHANDLRGVAARECIENELMLHLRIMEMEIRIKREQERRLVRENMLLELRVQVENLKKRVNLM